LSPAERELIFARRSLLVLLATAILVQPLSSLAAYEAIQPIESGADTWTLWAHYDSSPAPDVLFVGDSRVRQAVDAGAISRELSGQAGHTITVSRVGLSNADPALLDTLLYRVMSRASRPKTIVIALSEFGFNASYQPDRTADYWQLSFPPDPGFMRVALAHDWNRSRLVAGWAVPLIAHAPILAEGVQCLVQPSPKCTIAAHLFDDRMTQATHDLIITYYIDLYLRDFKWSETELHDVVLAADRVRAGGARLAFVVMPINGIAELSAPFYADYLEHIHALAASRAAPLADLHAAVNEADWSLWADPSHLNDRGAVLMAPQLAAVASGAT
jgi:hypothetical protein